MTYIKIAHEHKPHLQVGGEVSTVDTTQGDAQDALWRRRPSSLRRRRRGGDWLQRNARACRRLLGRRNAVVAGGAACALSVLTCHGVGTVFDVEGALRVVGGSAAHALKLRLAPIAADLGVFYDLH